MAASTSAPPGAAGAPDLPGAFLELPAGAPQNRQEVVEPGDQTVPRPGLAHDERPQASRVDGDSLDAVGRLGALDESRLAQRLEELRRLPGVEFLSPFRFGDVGHEPGCPGRQSQLLEAIPTE
jgi:hypothetical protein